MKDAMQTFFAKKKVKQGNDYVFKDVEVNIFELQNKEGVSLGEILLNQQSKIDKLERAVERITSAFRGAKK